MLRRFWTLLGVCGLLVGQLAIADEQSVNADLVLVKGAGGESQYESAFVQWRQIWQDVATSVPWRVHLIGSDTKDGSDRERLRETLGQLANEPPRPLWIVLIGHGTYFQDQVKFNLTGPDITADDLAEWLKPLQRPVAIIICASCSGAFVDRLSAADRVIVTSTRSGAEQNYSRFGQFLAEAIRLGSADIDHDGVLSLLEAFLTAARKTQSFYADEGRLATEHALLDDNGDRSGTTADFFRGIRVTGKPEGEHAVDGLRAHQWMLTRLTNQPLLSPENQAQRDELEREIEALRNRKAEMDDDEYYGQLEVHLVKLAQLYLDGE